MKLELATKQYLEANRSKGSAQLITAASRAIDAGRPKWEKVLTVISAALIEDFGNEIAEDLGGEPKSDKLIPIEAKLGEVVELKWTFDPMSAEVRAWIVKHGAESIKTILATNLTDVKRIILAGIDEDLTTVQLSRSLRQFYADHSPYKAMRVARTETSHAAGFGQRESARQSGVVKTHTWITSRDDRVRDEHAAIDGETTNFNKSYSTGEMYPGENSINCRCVESFGVRK